jgi:hypothetical protein
MAAWNFATAGKLAADNVAEEPANADGTATVVRSTRYPSVSR